MNAGRMGFVGFVAIAGLVFVVFAHLSAWSLRRRLRGQAFPRGRMPEWSLSLTTSLARRSGPLMLAGAAAAIIGLPLYLATSAFPWAVLAFFGVMGAASGYAFRLQGREVEKHRAANATLPPMDKRFYGIAALVTGLWSVGFSAAMLARGELPLPVAVYGFAYAAVAMIVGVVLLRRARRT